jgi:hypothetical protein
LLNPTERPAILGGAASQALVSARFVAATEGPCLQHAKLTLVLDIHPWVMHRRSFGRAQPLLYQQVSRGALPQDDHSLAYKLDGLATPSETNQDETHGSRGSNFPRLPRCLPSGLTEQGSRVRGRRAKPVFGEIMPGPGSPAADC